jgi:hypothetical protein
MKIQAAGSSQTIYQTKRCHIPDADNLYWGGSLRKVKLNKLDKNTYHQGQDFDDMSSFFPCILCDALKYINLGYELLDTEM